MSIKVMSWVWEHSQEKGTARLVLLAIADFANDNGVAWPSVNSLAKKASVSDRTAQRILKRLIESGTIEIQLNEGPKGCNLYIVRGCQSDGVGRHSVGGDKSTGVTNRAQRGDIAVSPEPSGTVSNTDSLTSFESTREKENDPEPEPPPKRKPDPPNSRRCRKLEDLVLDEQDRAWCAEKCPGVDPDAMVEELRDWTLKKRKNRYDDWRAGWRTFCRNAYEKIKNRPQSKPNKHQTSAANQQRIMREADAILRQSSS